MRLQTMGLRIKERPSAAREGRESRREAINKMARPEGCEPPTNGFGSHYSIRLSYGRVVLLNASARQASGPALSHAHPCNGSHGPRRITGTCYLFAA